MLVLPTFQPAAMAEIYTLYSLRRHWYHGAHSIYSDPPMAEIVIFSRLPSACIWHGDLSGTQWWPKVMYDFQVIHSLAEMKGQPGRPPAYKRPTSSNHLLPFDPIRRQLAVCLIYLKLIDLALHPTHAHRRFNWHWSRNENEVLHDQKVRERQGRSRRRVCWSGGSGK